LSAGIWLFLQTLSTATGRALDGTMAEAVRRGVLTEPQVARAVVERLPHGSALFLGNSMPIRDVDFYSGPFPSDGGSPKAPNGETALGASGSGGGGSSAGGAEETQVGMRVASNRGASGIDGVVSTAAGFAAGLQRPVTLLIGDVSFMHDSNALLLLREQHCIPPLCVVVVNNQGGGIFNFLPVAAMLPESTFKPLFSTPPGVDMSLLCKAHRVPHLTATTPAELHAALAQGWGMRRHCVVEVFTDPTRNTTDHQQLSSSARTAAERALQVTAESPHEFFVGIFPAAHFSSWANDPYRWLTLCGDGGACFNWEPQVMRMPPLAATIPAAARPSTASSASPVPVRHSTRALRRGDASGRALSSTDTCPCRKSR
jgi:isochorismate synthase/2-succinyl-5-enolpyruvyl-6-hydroxy-3-cyclohexene-1-carboxylate synthase/2-succinyl-6-hydroxy-2,4-cyclohexadiene-1-carboxylate synthase/O-succinylbenzoate synthase